MNPIEKKMLALQQEREQKAKEKIWFAIQPAPKVKDFSNTVYQKKKIPTVKIVEDLSPSQKVLVKHFEFISHFVEQEDITHSGNEHAFNIAVREYIDNIRVVRSYPEKQVWEIIKNKFRREYNFLKTHHGQNKKTGT